MVQCSIGTYIKVSCHIWTFKKSIRRKHSSRTLLLLVADSEHRRRQSSLKSQGQTAVCLWSPFQLLFFIFCNNFLCGQTDAFYIESQILRQINLDSCDSWWATCHTKHHVPPTLDCPDFLQLDIFSKETKHSASLASMNFPTPYLQTHLFGLNTYHLNTCNIEPFSNLSQACKLIGGLMKESQTDPSRAQQNHPYIDQQQCNKQEV